MAAAPTPRLTPEQYPEIERKAETRSEYFQGRMYALAGGSYWHGVLIGNVSRQLGNALREKPCTVTPSEVRLRISSEGPYTYPGVMVVCGRPLFADQRRDTLLNPILIVEVLSPSTEGHDRGVKFAQYRRLESLKEYVLVAQQEARVERYLRQTGGDWLLTEFVGLDAVCRLHSLDIEIPLRDLYEKVDFADAAAP